MALKILLVVALVLIIGGGLVVWIRRARISGRTIGQPKGNREQEPERVFVGDVMRQRVVTSGGLARLEIFDWGIRVRGTVFSRWVVPTWDARFEELAIAELVKTQQSRIAVWFRLRDEPGGGTAFLSSWHGEILGLLEQHDVPVNRSVTGIRSPAELYRAAR